MAEVTTHTAGARVSRWGEGPVWWRDHLLYVDIEGRAVVRFDPATGEERAFDVGERVGAVAPRESGGWVIAGDNGFSFFDPETGEKTPLADPESHRGTDYRFNDGKCDPAGRFWAGSISLKKEVGTAALYLLDTDGSWELKVPEVTNSNGLCWTADARTMYYIDTPAQQVRAYDFDKASGAISNARVVIDTLEAGFESSPDGMTIDAEDMVWIAFCHGGCVVRFDPRCGEPLHRLDFPCAETTSCAFGGPDLDRLFVTTGQRKGVDEPGAGRLFVVDGLGVKGVPAVGYRG
jgi:sugar lactone lactonase YvrE